MCRFEHKLVDIFEESKLAEYKKSLFDKDSAFLLLKLYAFVPGDPFYAQGYAGKSADPMYAPRADAPAVNTMRLNFTNADCAAIEEGIRRLGDLLYGHLVG